MKPMPQFVKMGIGTQGYMPKAGASLRARARHAARRVIKPGFPRTEPFRDRAEIETYFASEFIECLLCGRSLKRLGIHLQRIHGIGEDDYRKRYGLAWRRGLTGSVTHELYVASGARNIERLRVMGEESRAAARVAPRRPKTPIQLTELKACILDSSNLVEFSEADFSRFLDAIASGLTPQEATRLPQMPGLAAWRKKRMRDASYDARFREIWESLPFPVQARGQRLGARFERECERLFRQGHADRPIADQLGVTTMAVNRRTRVWRNPPEATC